MDFEREQRELALQLPEALARAKAKVTAARAAVRAASPSSPTGGENDPVSEETDRRFGEPPEMERFSG